jgi:hypothetical protein
MPAEIPVVAVAASSGESHGIGRGGLSVGALLAWACVGIPIAWGVYVTLGQALILFR